MATEATCEARRYHDWQTGEGGGWTCADCAESCPACCVCEKATESSLLICDRCLQREARILDDIVTAVGWYRWAPPSTIKATRYDRERISGSGDGGSSARWAIGDLPDVLDSWADMWAGVIGETRTISGIDFLKGRLIWAAHNQEASAWDDYRKEARTALVTAKREAGLLPKRMPAPCAHCGGTVVRTWADARLTPHSDGISDEVVCLGCGLTWKSETHYRQLSKQHTRALPTTHPEMLVTIKEAHAIWPEVPNGTWRYWSSAGRLPEHAGWDERGVPVYRVGELAEVCDHWGSDTRKGPKRKDREGVA